MSAIDPGNGGVTPQAPIANRYTPDAHEQSVRLRTMAEAFPDDPDPRHALKPSEMRLARQTSAAMLEKTAAFAEAAPAIGAPAATNVAELRDAIAFELAYVSVRDDARALARRIDLAILRRKLKAVKSARGFYQVAKSVALLDVGEPVRPHVEDLKRALTPRRIRKTVPPAAKAAEQK
jgi:hypothetical protein